MSIEVRIDRAWAHHGYRIWIIDKSKDSYRVAKHVDLKFEKVGEGELIPSPPLEFSTPGQGRDFLQGLCDALTEVGYRPNSDKIAGKLEAQGKHLEDMRSLVFKDKR